MRLQERDKRRQMRFTDDFTDLCCFKEALKVYSSVCTCLNQGELVLTIDRGT